MRKIDPVVYYLYVWFNGTVCGQSDNGVKYWKRKVNKDPFLPICGGINKEIGTVDVAKMAKDFVDKYA